MIVEPKSKGFICTTAHPTGCYENVKEQIAYAKKEGSCYENRNSKDIKKALIIGCSTGYGLASRIAAAYIYGCDTLGIMFEREASGKRTATAGMYNTKAFEAMAKQDGLYAKTINGDAFSRDVKAQAAQCIKEDFGKIDLVIYSLAAPKRTMPDGTIKSSVLKTIDEAFTTKSLNLNNNEITEVSLNPATKEEIESTISVMGGEDWMDWIRLLHNENLLSEDAMTIAYSYLGPELTYPIYQSGTIGQAKKDLELTAKSINESKWDLKAYVCVNKAVVTQSSAAIPGVPLYLSILYKIMKDKGLHEDCIMQMVRLLKDRLNSDVIDTDGENRIRMDDWEMQEEIQSEVKKMWDLVSNENVEEICDIKGYWDEFFKMFGFGIKNVDYLKDVEV